MFSYRNNICPLSLPSTGCTSHKLHVICISNTDILTSHPGHTATQLLLQILKIIFLFYPALRMTSWKTNNLAAHELYQLSCSCFTPIYLPQFYNSLRNSDYHPIALHAWKHRSTSSELLAASWRFFHILIVQVLLEWWHNSD